MKMECGNRRRGESGKSEEGEKMSDEIQEANLLVGE